MAYLLIALIGLIVGVIINMLADDLPHYRVPRQPHYADDTPRPPIAWSGIVAFATGRRQSAKQESVWLSWRYPITELGTALLFVLTLSRINTINSVEYTVNGLQTAFWLFYVAVFVLILVTDIEHHLILFSVIIPSVIVALLDAALTPEGPPFAIWHASSAPGLVNALIGAGVGFGVFFAFYAGGFLYTRVVAELRGLEIDDVAFGYGDVMLSTLCGLILGWQPLIFAMFITVFLGALGAVLFLTIHKLRRREGGMLIALPYGPYIVVGALVMLLYSDAVRSFLLGAAYG
jgi:prepilin signal peptidase PulO-like enzyme (type II secretory pathway)